MALIQGTAANYSAFWTTLRNALTSNGWAVAIEHSGTEIVVQGPGLSSSDQIYVGMKLVSRPTPDEYEIQISGCAGVLADGLGFDQHINSSPTHVRIFLDSNPFDYWIAVNGRRFVVVLKISTIFQAAYGGFFLPYAAPTEYAYPLFIGGSVGQQSSVNATSWRSTDIGHRHFPHSYYDPTSPTLRPPAALMMDPAGNWLTCAATGSEANVAVAPRRFHAGMGISATYSTNNYGYADIRQRLSDCFGGGLLLTPITLLQSSPSDQTYGILDGCYHVPGFNNSSENIVTVGSVDHLVVQDVFRTDHGEYWALGLE